MLGALLRERKNEVLEIARERLQSKLPDHPVEDVVDQLPAVLDHIVEALQEDNSRNERSEMPEVTTLAAEHGRQREQLGIDLSQVANDYGSVCDAISEMAKRCGIEVPATEWQTLNRALDLCIAVAISSYRDQNVTKARRQTALHLGGVAHELRNALATVRVAFDAIRTGRVGATSRTSEVLDRHLRYLAEMVNDLVGQSRLNAGVPAAPEALPLRTFIEDLATSTPPRNGVRIETVVAADLTVRADPQLLTSALTNLLQNAIKFTRAGGRVVIRGRQEGDQVLIEVEDQCGGIPDQQIKAIFAPFVQQSADRTGLGLGLSLVLEAMRAHGGSVQARNIPGQGCVFILSLPVHQP